MGAAREGQQEVDGQRPVAQPAGRGNLPAQVIGREDADRSQAAGRRDRRGELVPRQAAAHAGLHDRQLHPESLQKSAHVAPLPGLGFRRVALRCVYTDLDGTMLGKGASLLRDAEGNFSTLAIRALEACHRAGVEVVIQSGRRKAQVYEDARLIGQPSYIYEMGSGLVDGDDEVFLTGSFEAGEESVHDQIERAGRAAPADGDVPAAHRAARAVAHRPAVHAPAARRRAAGRGGAAVRRARPRRAARRQRDHRAPLAGADRRRGARVPPDPGRGGQGEGRRDAHAPARLWLPRR